MFKNLDDGKQALNDAIEEGKTYDKYRLVSLPFVTLIKTHSVLKIGLWLPDVIVYILLH